MAITFKGFTIVPTFKSQVNGRTCTLIQGYITTHPAGTRATLPGSGRELGWSRRLEDAKQKIQDSYDLAYGRTGKERGLGYHNIGCARRLAIFWPNAPMPPKAIAEHEAQYQKNRQEMAALNQPMDAQKVAVLMMAWAQLNLTDAQKVTVLMTALMRARADMEGECMSVQYIDEALKTVRGDA